MEISAKLFLGSWTWRKDGFSIDSLLAQCTQLVPPGITLNQASIDVVVLQINDEDEVNLLDRKQYSKAEQEELMQRYQVSDLPALVVFANHDNKSSPTETIYIPATLAVDRTPEEVVSLSVRALESYEQFDLQSAISGYTEVLLPSSSTTTTTTNGRQPHTPALFNLASIYHMIGYPTLAVHLMERLLLVDASDATAHSFLWALTSSGQCDQVSRRAYERLAAGGDTKAVTKLAVLTGAGSTAIKGDPKYAQLIYDEMADTFENKLVDKLGYKGPWILRDMLLSALHESSSLSTLSAAAASSVFDAWRMLDLGCGSGLVGRVFRQNAVLGGGEGEGEEQHTPSPPPPPPPPAAAAIIPDAVVNADASTSTSSVFSSAASSTNNNIAANNSNDSDSNRSMIEDELTRAARYATGPITAGVDISPKIAEIARKTGAYSHIQYCDVEKALEYFDTTTTTTSSGGGSASSSNSSSSSTGTTTGLDLAIAADTFIYVGALGSVFYKAANALRTMTVRGDNSNNSNNNSGGYFVFSVEDLDSSHMKVTHKTSPSSSDTTACCSLELEHDIQGAVPGWGCQLLSSGRFAHSDSYIRALAAMHGFHVRKHRVVLLRTEETLPINGNFYVLQKK